MGDWFCFETVEIKNERDRAKKLRRISIAAIKKRCGAQSCLVTLKREEGQRRLYKAVNIQT